jgi:hypothetical protein
VSIPDGSQSNVEDEGKKITFSTNQLSKQMSIYFRTEDMLSPAITYGEHANFPNEYVCQISFVPTFEPVDPQSNLEVVEAEVPMENDMLD